MLQSGEYVCSSIKNSLWNDIARTLSFLLSEKACVTFNSIFSIKVKNSAIHMCLCCKKERPIELKTNTQKCHKMSVFATATKTGMSICKMKQNSQQHWIKKTHELLRNCGYIYYVTVMRYTTARWTFWIKKFKWLIYEHDKQNPM